jgi:hypothetical protein
MLRKDKDLVLELLLVEKILELTGRLRPVWSSIDRYFSWDSYDDLKYECGERHRSNFLD